MAAPTSYTEATLKAYMHSVLGAVATSLGWSVAGSSYDEAVNEAIIGYGVTDIANATTIQKLRALARREVWRAVMAEVSGDYDHSIGGMSVKRSQAYEQAEKQFRLAQSDCMALGADGWEMAVDAVEYNDPYKPLEDDS